MIDYIVSLFTNPVALIGLLASIVVLISMCFNTKTLKGSFWLRLTNLLGSVISVVYGLLLELHVAGEGAGMILLNGILVVVNVYYLVKIIPQMKSDVQ